MHTAFMGEYIPVTAFTAPVAVEDPLGRAKSLSCQDPASCALQVEPPGRGDALRTLRALDAGGTSLWWRSYVRITPFTALGHALQVVRHGLPASEQ